MRHDIELVGFARCAWSGFGPIDGTVFEQIAPGCYYSDRAFRLGFWVYRWRKWETLKP